MHSQRSKSSIPADVRFEWVDIIKAVAILWVFLNHASEKLFGFPYFANPAAGWPVLVDRVRQLAPISGYGLWDGPLNLTRWIGWSGDQGVQLFLILSGFGLTWGLLKKQAPDHLALGQFYVRWLRRILPPWWAVHILAFVAALAGGYAILLDHRFYLSVLGIRVTPDMLYYIQPGWWYVCLLLQLYIVFPLLWRILRKQGTKSFFLLAILVPLSVRFLGLLYFEEYLDAWSRGAIFVTRLPEFALGMLLASWLFGEPETRMAQLKAWRTWFAGLPVYALGLFSAFFLYGMALAPVLLGSGALLLLFKSAAWIGVRSSLLNRALLWIGGHSYSLYLIHGFFIRFVVPDGVSATLWLVYLKVLLALVLSCIAAFVMDAIISRVLNSVLHSKES